jgi:histidinol-phosphate aminotransferase
VNLLAEAAGIGVLADHVFLAETLRTVLEGREYLRGALAGLGCELLDSQANFLMFKPSENASLVYESLLRKGIIVRPLASFGLPEWIRVNVGTAAENKDFVQALQEVMENG